MPHRISLRRGWKITASEPWERVFHAPTLPATTVAVRLVIAPCSSDAQIHLNGDELAWSQADSRLDCEVRDRLQRLNRLTLGGVLMERSHIKEGERQELPSPFDAYLEIDDDE